MVALHHFSFPGVGQVGADHDEVQRGELFFRVAYDAFPVRIHHEVDFIFGMVMHGVIKVGVRMVKDDEQVVVGNRDNLFLYLFHKARGFADKGKYL